MKLIKNILVPTDFSHHSSHAINYACDLASSFSANMHLLNVGDSSLQESDRLKTLERLGNVVSARTELKINTVKTFVAGDPKKQIIDYIYSKRIDLVVMGTHGRTGLSHLTMGSVAESVVKESPCPVTVLGPHDGENATHAQAVEVVTKLIENGLPTEEEEARTVILKALVEHLRVSSTSAILMFGEIVEQGWVLFEDGQWIVVEGTDLIDDLEPIQFNSESETQAVELVRRAATLRATDVHVDPVGDSEFLVRFRIDGRLREYCRLDRAVGDHLLNQCKSLANVDHADPFHAHEGRMRLPVHLSDLEVRLTSVPVPEGQAMTLRIHDPVRVFKPLDDLGMVKSEFGKVESILQQGEGLVLVTGPTGAGKTTTVYSMLESLGATHKNIVSIEDPVEFTAPFVRQINVDEKHDITMAGGLRTLLRMDPDVLFIGEIRDPATAEIGMRAATSGMYVFSTLHTRDIASSIFSFENFGVSRNSIVSHLSGIVNQRLFRTLCGRCKKALPVTQAFIDAFERTGLEIPDQLYEPDGCSKCGGTGFHGRTGVFEILALDDEIRDLLRPLDSRQAVESLIRSRGTDSLHTDALRKAAAGTISIHDANDICWLS